MMGSFYRTSAAFLMVLWGGSFLNAASGQSTKVSNHSQVSKETPKVPQGHRIHIYQENEMGQLYHTAAQEVIKLLRQNPQAVILLPTGSTPEKMYREIIAHFKDDASFDLSQAKFFNLDEYVGLSPEHPLSYSYYMETHFYGPLHTIDAKRAPQKENVFILSGRSGESPQATVNRFKADLKKAGQIDLAILGVGGAFIAKGVNGEKYLRGGHIAFNEPGTKPTQETHMVTLTAMTRRDTKHRFSSLQAVMEQGEVKKQVVADVPSKALTVGLKEILSAQKVIMLATGEGKEPVVRELFKKASNPDFPASYLLKHSNVSWYFDEFAGKSLNVKPWVYVASSNYFPKNWLKKCAKCLVLEKKSMDTIALADFVKEGIPAEVVKAYRSHRFRNASGEEAILKDFQRGLMSNVNELPQGKKILILSPHPDDDVISMGATLKKLVDLGNDVHVVYAVDGSNAVRENLDSYKHAYAQKALKDPLKASFEAKVSVREQEAAAATKIMGIDPKNLHYFRADYYMRRGIPGVEPFSKKDTMRMETLLVDVNPDVIFFAAEDDPHGAHGLASKLVAKSLESLEKHGTLTGVEVMGYRGAWNEWNLESPENLTFVGFDESEMARKIEAIKAHESQLNPLFPGHDTREFFERAVARNREVAQEYNMLVAGQGVHKELGNKSDYMEVFKRFAAKEFIKGYR